jgi:hypothetical protein
MDEEARFSELVSLKNLRKAWTIIRKEAKEVRARDPIDCLDWANSIDVTLPQIRLDLLSGEFTPSPPTRYTLAKSKGAFRIMTIPSIKDAIVYRLICDRALELALSTNNSRLWLLGTGRPTSYRYRFGISAPATKLSFASLHIW